jgi:hypothetical protein
VTNETGAFDGVSFAMPVVIEATWRKTLPTSGRTIPFWEATTPGVRTATCGLPGAGSRGCWRAASTTRPVVRPVLFIDGESVYENTLIP